MERTGILVSFASIDQPRQSKVLELGGEVVHVVGGEAEGILGGPFGMYGKAKYGKALNGGLF